MNDRSRPEAAHGAAAEKHTAGSGFEPGAPRRLDSRAEIEDWVAERWRVLSELVEAEELGRPPVVHERDRAQLELGEAA
jgi:hypothetical protein